MVHWLESALQSGDLDLILVREFRLHAERKQAASTAQELGSGACALAEVQKDPA